MRRERSIQRSAQADGGRLTAAARPRGDIDDAIAERISSASVVPVITIENRDDAYPLTRALSTGGLPVVEITLRTDDALAALERAVAADHAVVGAGTVTHPAQVTAAARSGARFVVSPGLIPAVVHQARDERLLPIPGIATPTELVQAHTLGLRVVKLFPAEVVGGLRMVSALDALAFGISFMPTGGIKPSQLSDYLRNSAVSAVGGSWLTPRQAVHERNWNAITQLAREAATIRDAARTDGPQHDG